MSYSGHFHSGWSVLDSEGIAIRVGVEALAWPSCCLHSWLGVVCLTGRPRELGVSYPSSVFAVLAGQEGRRGSAHWGRVVSFPGWSRPPGRPSGAGAHSHPLCPSPDWHRLEHLHKVVSGPPWAWSGLACWEGRSCPESRACAALCPLALLSPLLPAAAVGACPVLSVTGAPAGALLTASPPVAAC